MSGFCFHKLVYVPFALYALLTPCVSEGQCAVNNDFFEVYRSTDLENWELVSKVPGAGNSVQLKNYMTTDFDPYPGLSYYKLLQADFDGTTTSGGIRSVMINSASNLEEISVFSNPTSGEIRITGDNEVLHKLKLFNSLSQQVDMRIVVTGENNVVVDLSNIASGVYILKSNEGSYRIVKE